MRKIMNAPKDFVDDFLDGLLKAYPRDFRAVPGSSPSSRHGVEPPGVDPKVAIVTGGGYRAPTALLGLRRSGSMQRGGGRQHVFLSLGSTRFWPRQGRSEPGKGVLFLYGNYSGDGINFDDAADMAGDDGIETVTVRAADESPPRRLLPR